jgi:carbon storage regulator
MLVLSRKDGEAILIGDGVRVRVLEIKGNRVKIGVEAPLDTPVFREEVKMRAPWDLDDHAAAMGGLPTAGRTFAKSV